MTTNVVDMEYRGLLGSSQLDTRYPTQLGWLIEENEKGGNMVGIDKSDMLKLLDVLKINEEFHIHRDKMNSTIHLAKEVRFSPLTSETISAKERLEKLIENEKGGI